jgi:hypothetical protein
VFHERFSYRQIGWFGIENLKPETDDDTGGLLRNVEGFSNESAEFVNGREIARDLEA